MGKIAFDRIQQLVIDELLNDSYLRSHFYFTGGTALSVFHLQHRYSEDLDFFTHREFIGSKILSFVNAIGKKYGFTHTLRQPEGTDIFIFSLEKNKLKLKVDFNHYPFALLEKPNIVNGLQVDSLRDIATNKLLTVNQRTEVKDFVDLYFLLKKYTIWDLFNGVEIKFGVKLERFMVASDMMKVENFTNLPRIIKPLSLDELKSFFRSEAEKLGRLSVY